MKLKKSTLLTILLVAFGTILSYGQITLSNEAFDAYAKKVTERNAYKDSLQLCKSDLQECDKSNLLLQDKAQGFEFALNEQTRSADSYRLELGDLRGKHNDTKKWNRRFKKTILGISVVAVLEGLLIYGLVSGR